MMKIRQSGNQLLQFHPTFVCGAPRSGTTLLLSLICTSQQINPLSAECDYFTALVQAFIVGRNRFDLHTQCYFESIEDFERYHAEVLRKVLTDMWWSLESPSRLVLKDPGITRYINIFLKLLPESRYVVALRDPRDVVSSRMTIEMRRLGLSDASELSGDFIEMLCREYNAVHEYLLTLGIADLERVKLIRYEHLVSGTELHGLSAFLHLNDIEPEKLWQRSVQMGRRTTHQEWISPLYGKAMSQEAVGRHHGLLTGALLEQIDTTCRGTYQQLLTLGGRHESA